MYTSRGLYIWLAFLNLLLETPVRNCKKTNMIKSGFIWRSETRIICTFMNQGFFNLSDHWIDCKHHSHGCLQEWARFVVKFSVPGLYPFCQAYILSVGHIQHFSTFFFIVLWGPAVETHIASGSRLLAPTENIVDCHSIIPFLCLSACCLLRFSPAQ